jgi:hypothetical protein
MSLFKDVFWDKLESILHDLKMQYFCQHVKTRLEIVEDAILQIEHGSVLNARSDVTWKSFHRGAEILVEEVIWKTSLVPQCGDMGCRGCYQIDLPTALQHMCASAVQSAFHSVSCGQSYGL